MQPRTVEAQGKTQCEHSVLIYLEPGTVASVCLFLTPSNHLWCLLRLPLPKPRAQKFRILLHPAKGKSSLHPRKRISSRAYPTTPRRTSSRVHLTPRKKIGVAALKIRARIPGAAPTFPRFLGLREVVEGREDGRRLTSTVSPQRFCHNRLRQVR